MNKRPLILAVLAPLLIAAGLFLRQTALVEERLADVREELAISGRIGSAEQHDLDAALAPVHAVPVIGTRLSAQVSRRQTEAAYWKGDYDAVTGSEKTGEDAVASNADPELLMLFADADFRRALRSNASPDVLIRTLEGVQKRYAAVLAAAPAVVDASYNYEFVARLRQALAQGRRPSPPPPNHQLGDEGGPPTGSEEGDFKLIVPLQPEERQDETTPGGGPRFRRRG